MTLLLLGVQHLLAKEFFEWGTDCQGLISYFNFIKRQNNYTIMKVELRKNQQQPQVP